MTTNRYPRGLTLIETLVAIAVIVIVAALLSTVFRLATDAAKNAGCISNLGQIGKATELYTADNSGLLPPYFTDQRTGPDGILHEPNLPQFFGSMRSYGLSPHILFCPLDTDAGKMAFHRAEMSDHMVTSYGVSSYVHLFADQTKSHLDFSLSSVVRPSQTMYMFDSGWNDNGGQEWTTAHGKSQNVLYFDWHVAAHHTHLPVCVWPEQDRACERQ